MLQLPSFTVAPPLSGALWGRFYCLFGKYLDIALEQGEFWLFVCSNIFLQWKYTAALKTIQLQTDNLKNRSKQDIQEHPVSFDQQAATLSLLSLYNLNL